MKLNLPLTFALVFVFFANTLSLNAQANKLQSDLAYSTNSSSTERISTTNMWDYFIYPVPANDVLNVKITKGDVAISKVVVTNEEGEEVMVLENQNSEKLKLNLETMKPGKYYIQIVSDEYQVAKVKRFYVVN